MLTRCIGQIIGLVDGFGGDSRSIAPSPTGVVPGYPVAKGGGGDDGGDGEAGEHGGCCDRDCCGGDCCRGHGRRDGCSRHRRRRQPRNHCPRHEDHNQGKDGDSDHDDDSNYEEHNGKVHGLIYNFFGDFAGFELETGKCQLQCFYTRKTCLEGILRAARGERAWLRVRSNKCAPNYIKEVLLLRD